MVKKDELGSFFSKFNLDICCVQETKLESFTERDGMSIWTSRGIKWCAEGAVGRSGGLLTFWDDKKLSCLSHWGVGGAIVVNGIWRATGEELCIVNVYALCNAMEKARLWDRLSLIVGQREESYTCLIGDFNTILHAEERTGVGDYELARDRRVFADFVERCGLVDVNFLGRKFTWYKNGGLCKSRIDKAFVNRGWAAKWPDSVLRGVPRSVSDHFALILATRREDWGPTPFRFVNAWLTSEGFRERVVESWRDEEIEGWGSFVLKEKLKRLKKALKVWNKERFGNLDEEVKELRGELHSLDIRDDHRGLGEGEIVRRSEVTAQLLVVLSRRKSLLSQKAKLK